MKSICLSNGFKCRGKAFFRVIGDGVLQVLKFEKERRRPHPDIWVGLFSAYGLIMDQWLQSWGCIPRYLFYKLYLEDPPGFTWQITSQPIEVQLDLLKEKGIPWLDTMNTQERLFQGICELDISHYKKILWNDDLKIAPTLASNQLEACQTAVRAMLTQHDNAAQSRKNELNPEEFQSYVTQMMQEDAPLHEILHMIDTGDTGKIESLLKQTYVSNLKKLRFCTR